METRASGRSTAWAEVCSKSTYSDLRRLARRLCRRTRTEYLEQDVAQAGALGLLEARVRFEPDRGVPFGAFAHRRITGAMLDEIRGNMPLSRRAWGNGLHLGVAELADDVADAGYSAEDALLRAHDLSALRQALQRLSQDEQASIAAVYDLDDLGTSGAAHARLLGRSRSWISRLHRGALDEMRQAMGVEVQHG